MIPWTEADFQRVALTTKLADRTIAACRDVLVDGISGVDAGKRWQLNPAQISRGLGVLKNKQSEILESADALKIDSNLLKYTVAQIAKCMMGEKFNVSDAVPGKVYEGPVIISSHGFLVQKVGRAGIAHDLGDFKQMPQLNVPLSISYPKDGGQPNLATMDLVDDRSQGWGRRSEDFGR